MFMVSINGLEFEYDGIFFDILTTINNNTMYNERKWLVDCLWVEGPTGEAYQTMNAQTYPLCELLKHFSCLGQNFVFFIRIREYGISDNIDHISTFEDFQKSDCKMVLIMADSKFYGIYAKDEIKQRSVQYSLISLLSIDAEFVPMDSITRTGLTV